jgi:hypothetical protein
MTGEEKMSKKTENGIMIKLKRNEEIKIEHNVMKQKGREGSNFSSKGLMSQ